MRKKILLGLLTIICILIKPCIEEIFTQSSDNRNNSMYSLGYCGITQCSYVTCKIKYSYATYNPISHYRIGKGSICGLETSQIVNHSTSQCCNIGIGCSLCGYKDHTVCHIHSALTSYSPISSTEHQISTICSTGVSPIEIGGYNPTIDHWMGGQFKHSFPASDVSSYIVEVKTFYGTYYLCPTCGSYYCGGSYGGTESHTWSSGTTCSSCTKCGYANSHALTYTSINSAQHHKQCSICTYGADENHSMVYCCPNGNRCQYCGYKNHICHVCSFTECSKPHCTVTYCPICTTTHTCDGDHTYTTCPLAHCGARYCTKCGHSCGGDHTYTICNLAHCGKNYCTKCGHSCGGGHTYVICSLGHCGVSYCTKCPPHTCGGDHVSSNVWTDTGNQHVVYCRQCTNKIYTSHAATDWAPWENYTETLHRRICNACNTSTYGNKIYDTEEHMYNKSYKQLEKVDTNYLTYHNATCYADTCGRVALQEHEDINNDYICDKCNIELWQITCDPGTLTNSDVTATLKLWKPRHCSNPEINRKDNTFIHVFTENGEYDFVLESPAKTITATVDWISKSIKGRIIYSPISVTSGEVIASFVPDYEGLYDKGKRITVESITMGGQTTSRNEEIAENGKCDYVFKKNGAAIFNLKDNIGNIASVTATVNWIIDANRATISNTYHVMKGGFVFTNILVKADENWSLQDLSDSIELKINKKGSAEEILGAVKDIVKINDYYYTEDYKDFTGSTVFNKGIYYISIGIGGSKIFDDVNEVYEVEIKGVKGSETIYFTGKNKMEVKPYDLPDLT